MFHIYRVKLAGTEKFILRGHLINEHTTYLSRTLRTLSVEQQISCGAILLHLDIFDGLVEQNRFTWQAILPRKTKLFVLWSNFVMWINDKLLLVPNFAVRDKFKMFAVLKWFTLFWREIFFCDLRTFEKIIFWPISTQWTVRTLDICSFASSPNLMYPLTRIPNSSVCLSSVCHKKAGSAGEQTLRSGAAKF